VWVEACVCLLASVWVEACVCLLRKSAAGGRCWIQCRGFSDRPRRPSRLSCDRPMRCLLRLRPCLLLLHRYVIPPYHPPTHPSLHPSLRRPPPLAPHPSPTRRLGRLLASLPLSNAFRLLSLLFFNPPPHPPHSSASLPLHLPPLPCSPSLPLASPFSPIFLQS